MVAPKGANLETRLSDAVETGTQNLAILRQYVDETLAQIDGSSPPPSSDELVPAHQKQAFRGLLLELNDYIQQRARDLQPSDLLHIECTLTTMYPPECTKALVALMNAALKPNQHRELLFQMALTHAFSLFEALLVDILTVVLSYRPSTLKSGSSLTSEEVLQHSSITKLVHRLAERRAKSLVEGGLAAFAKDLAGKPFRIDVSQPGGFSVLREAQLRRDVVVHNSGHADARYCEHIAEVKEGTILPIDHEYLMLMFDAMTEFVEHFNQALAQKFRYSYHSGHNVLLWPTPFAAVMEIADAP